MLNIIFTACSLLFGYVFEAHIPTSDDCMFEQNERDRTSGKTYEIETNDGGKEWAEFG